jgi:hypothetical protein
MSIVKFKDFTIENITDEVHEVNEFQGTWADNRTNICEIMIDISTTVDGKDVDLKMTIKPQEIGAYHSYGDDRDKGFGISTEIFKDLISHAIEGVESLTLNEFVRHYFEKFGYTHSVELSWGRYKYLGQTILYLPTEDSKSTKAVSLVQILSDGFDSTDESVEVVQFTLEDLTADLMKSFASKCNLTASQQSDLGVALDHLQYAKAYATKQDSYVYYHFALDLLLSLKSQYSWGILPLELVCENNIMRGRVKDLYPTAIKKMSGDTVVYSLNDLLGGTK